MCFFFHAQSKWLTFSEFSKSPIHIVKAECICKVWVCIRKPLLLFSEACEAVYLCCDSIRFSSLSQQKHLNPTHLTLTQKERCDVTCMRERVRLRMCVWSIKSWPCLLFCRWVGLNWKDTTRLRVVPFLCFSSAHKNRQNSGQKIQLLACKS